jgi:hypothetical protein
VYCGTIHNRHPSADEFVKKFGIYTQQKNKIMDSPLKNNVKQNKPDPETQGTYAFAHV